MYIGTRSSTNLLLFDAIDSDTTIVNFRFFLYRFLLSQNSLDGLKFGTRRAQSVQQPHVNFGMKDMEQDVRLPHGLLLLQVAHKVMKCPVGQGHTVFGVQERCHRLVTLNVLDGHDVGEATNEACKAWIDKKSVLEKIEILADAAACHRWEILGTLTRCLL